MFKSLFRGPADSTTSSNNQFSNIILASGSPRRKQILQNPLLGLPAFDVVPSAFEEDLDKSKLSPKDYVLQTATEKAKEVARRLMLSSNHQQHCFKLLISADTVVHSAEDGRILEKPRDKDDARQMLTGNETFHASITSLFHLCRLVSC